MINLSEMAEDILQKLSFDSPQRKVRIQVEKGLQAQADPGLLKVVLENLLGNAWKYSRFKDVSSVEFAKVVQRENEVVYVVRDNGVGFNMKFVDKLFQAFQRLHEKDKKFEGTGIGLATVQRIIRLHGGQVWAEGLEQQGASFYFSLPINSKDVDKPRNILRARDSANAQVSEANAR
jgi:light-regulated signal transduction histidine kinase (bacteriophytochrome)